MDYDASLERAMDALPEYESEEGRFDVPSAQVQPDGAFTRLTNMDAIADDLGRDPVDVHRYVQRELGTSGQFESGTARYSGNFSQGDVDGVIEKYVDEFVLCSECGLPDTHLVREGRTKMLRCDACGAFRPVSTKATSQRASAQDREAVEEGETYEVKITGMGRKGDGVAERGKYTIFVPGASEGDVVTVYIDNVSGNLAFARLA